MGYWNIESQTRKFAIKLWNGPRSDAINITKQGQKACFKELLNSRRWTFSISEENMSCSYSNYHPPKKKLSEKWFNIVTKSCTFCKYPGFVCSFIYCVLSFLLVWRLSLCIKNIYLLLGLWSVVKHLPIMGNAKGLVPNATKKNLFYISYLISNFIPLICVMLTVISIWWKY